MTIKIVYKYIKLLSHWSHLVAAKINYILLSDMPTEILNGQYMCTDPSGQVSERPSTSQKRNRAEKKGSNGNRTRCRRDRNGNTKRPAEKSRPSDRGRTEPAVASHWGIELHKTLWHGAMRLIKPGKLCKKRKSGTIDDRRPPAGKRVKTERPVARVIVRYEADLLRDAPVTYVTCTPGKR